MIIFGTILSGVVVLVIGSILHTLILEPMKKHREVIGEIDYQLTYTAQLWGSPMLAKTFPDLPERTQEAMHQAEAVLRQCACRLGATTNVVMGYDVLSEWLGWIPSRTAVQEARGLLIGLSNTIFTEQDPEFRNVDAVRNIRRLLLLPEPPPGASI